MSALPSPAHNSPNQTDTIKKFRAEYHDAIGEAHEARIQTETPNWQRIYAEFHAEQKRKRREAAKALRGYADRLEDFGWSDDAKKAVKDIVKLSDELDSTTAAFERETVERITAPVRRCEALIIEARNAASRIESHEPLLNVGLRELMDDAIRSVEKATFDRERGVVVIK
jgi:hypothetical protein